MHPRIGIHCIVAALSACTATSPEREIPKEAWTVDDVSLVRARYDEEVSAAEAALLDGRADEAREGFERARGIHPTDERAVLGLAHAEALLGIESGARVQKLIDAKIDSPSVWFEIASIHDERGELNHAEAAYKKAFGGTTNRTGIALGLCNVLERQGKRLDAYELMVETTRVDTSSVSSWVRRAELAQQLGLIDEANLAWASVLERSDSHVFRRRYIDFLKATDQETTLSKERQLLDAAHPVSKRTLRPLKKSKR